MVGATVSERTLTSSSRDDVINFMITEYYVVCNEQLLLLFLARSRTASCDKTDSKTSCEVFLGGKNLRFEIDDGFCFSIEVIIDRISTISVFRTFWWKSNFSPSSLSKIKKKNLPFLPTPPPAPSRKTSQNMTYFQFHVLTGIFSLKKQKILNCNFLEIFSSFSKYFH